MNEHSLTFNHIIKLLKYNNLEKKLTKIIQQFYNIYTKLNDLN